MLSVESDLQSYLRKNIFPSRTVLVFPPFNGFRRFLIHKLIEDNFASAEVAAFSIGQDLNRRIVICYKGLISDTVSKGLPATTPKPYQQIMIDKEKPSRHKQMPTAAVYRPPAARKTVDKSADISKPPDSKQSRVRRPDQQVYVPRPKRASFSNVIPTSLSRSNSRLSVDSDQSLDVVNSSSSACQEVQIAVQDRVFKDCQDKDVLPSSNLIPNYTKLNDSFFDDNERCQPADQTRMSIRDEQNKRSHDTAKTLMPLNIETFQKHDVPEILNNESRMIGETVLKESMEQIDNCVTDYSISNERKEDDKQVNIQHHNHSAANEDTQHELDTNLNTGTLVHLDDKAKENNKTLLVGDKEERPQVLMEIISLSSDSRSEDSNSFISPSNSNTSISNPTIDFIEKKKCNHTASGEMDIDHFEENGITSRSQQEEEKTKTIKPSTKISEILVISDSSSGEDFIISRPKNSKKGKHLPKCDTGTNIDDGKINSSCAKQMKVVDPNECDWESLYDDSGECLVPSLMEELTKSVGKVRVTSADSDYRPYQSVEERTSDGECIIEIYDFPAEFKTTDLFNVFAAYGNKNFQIKWVDDTHALGIFSSPLMADEVLACTLPFVKTRPLRLGITESRIKARNLVLPPLPSAERPKTCSALAKRLVSGALGLRLPTTSQEREKEKQVLKEAREKRRLEAKQKQAAWDGTITSSSII